MWTVVFFLSLYLVISAYSKDCEKTNDVCEFYLMVEQKLTMMHGKDKVYPEEGKLYRYDVKNTSAAESVPMEGVISADGWEYPRRVIVVNGSMPGPPIIVYEGQNVVIHVTNLLTSQAVTIHWHGLHQRGTPWMDGVAFVTQCPILPGQKFTYRFKAKPKGTFWYHSHIGAQRTMGLFGAFIIRERQTLDMPEHIMFVQDWNHKWDSEIDHLEMVYGMYDNRTKMAGTKSLEGASFSMFSFTSGLVNGRGRYYDAYTNEHNGAPLETLIVKKGQNYRFRVIAPGALYPFRISIDNHNFTLVSSDGYDIEPVVSDFVIINPGERFDFILNADQAASNYWIRAETLEVALNHTAEAILRYDGAPDEEPMSRAKNCSDKMRCLVVNCPFRFYPEDAFMDCMTFDELNSKSGSTPAPVSDDTSQFKEYFLNFAFPGESWTPGSVNGRAFVAPDVSALTQPDEITTRCGDDCGEQKICSCSYGLDLKHGDVVQMVFLNMGKGKGWAHPIHMHGHSFYVMKMGYPSYNMSTGVIIEDNLDIDCRGNTTRELSYCNDATWSNASWARGNAPEMNLENATQKDTIIVPTGGYAVVRIKADNPGVWIMHCHIELHSIDGMALYLNESFSKHPAPPDQFPQCRSFSPSRSTDENIDNNTSSGVDTEKDVLLNPLPGIEWLTAEVFWVIVGILCVVILLQFFLIIYCGVSRRKSTMSMYVNSQKSLYGSQASN